MNILLVSELVGRGGREISLFNIAKELIKREHNPLVICSKYGKLTELLEEKNIPYRIVEISKNKKSLYKLFILKMEIKKIIEENIIDIIHCNEFSSSLLFGKIAKQKNIPLFCTCHDQWISVSDIERKKIEHYVERIFCISSPVYENLKKQNFSCPTIKKLSLGVDIKKFVKGVNYRVIENKMEGRKKNIVVGLISRFEKRKGQDVFVKAAKRVLEKNEEVKFVLIGDRLFGEEEQQHYESILQYVKKNNLEEDIYFLEERKDISHIMQEIDILIVPSYRESFGMIILEAFAAKRCVISTEFDGAKEVIENGIHGVLIPVGDEEALSKEILDLIGNEEKRKRLGEEGYNMVTQRYNIEKTVQKLLMEYMKVKT